MRIALAAVALVLGPAVFAYVWCLYHLPGWPDLTGLIEKDVGDAVFGRVFKIGCAVSGLVASILTYLFFKQ